MPRESFERGKAPSEPGRVLFMGMIGLRMPGMPASRSHVMAAARAAAPPSERAASRARPVLECRVRIVSAHTTPEGNRSLSTSMARRRSGTAMQMPSAAMKNTQGRRSQGLGLTPLMCIAGTAFVSPATAQKAPAEAAVWVRFVWRAVNETGRRRPRPRIIAMARIAATSEPSDVNPILRPA